MCVAKLRLKIPIGTEEQNVDRALLDPAPVGRSRACNQSYVLSNLRSTEQVKRSNYCKLFQNLSDMNKAGKFMEIRNILYINVFILCLGNTGTY